MYHPKVSLVNGEIIGDLLELCNEQFVDPLVKPYAGANSECIFCGATEKRSGEVYHLEENCPVLKYKALAKKHKKWIEKR